MAAKQPPTGETRSGYHYYTAWQTCPRSWFIRYRLHLRQATTPPSLPFGSAIHDTLADFYLSPGSPSKQHLLNRFDHHMKRQQPEYTAAEAYSTDATRGNALLEEWYSEVGEHLHHHYRVIEAEYPLEAVLYNGKRITVRLDRVVEHVETGLVLLIETKTTSWSYTGAWEQVAAADQATTYLLVAKKVGLHIDAVVPEILYNKGKICRAGWGPHIYRSEAELEDWEHCLVGVMESLDQANAAWETGEYPLGQLFPRNAPQCTFAHRCAHPDICRNPPINATVSPPPGYKWTS